MDYRKVFSTFIPIKENVDVAVEPISSGHINTTFKITAEQKEYILQKINHHVFQDPETLMNSISIVNNHLKKNNFPQEILENLPAQNGAYLSKDENGNFWRLAKYIPNTYSVTKVENAQQASEAAQTLSIFYSHLLDLNPQKIKPSIPGFIDFGKRLEDYKKALRNAENKRKEKAKRETAFVNSHLYLADKFIENQKNGKFPTRIIHADPKISNVLFDVNTKKGKCVIDLDTLMPGTILYDFGDMVRSYTNLREEDDPNPENVFSKEYYEAVKKGFLSHLSDQLTSIEKANLDYAGQVVVFIQSVRFLTDFLNGDLYYKTHYPDQNLDRTRNQLNLLSELRNLAESK